MSQSLTQVYVHLVFGTKNRNSWLNLEFESQLGKLPQKQYVLKVDKSLNFINVKYEKEYIQSCSDSRHSQRV